MEVRSWLLTIGLSCLLAFVFWLVFFLAVIMVQSLRTRRITLIPSRFRRDRLPRMRVEKLPDDVARSIVTPLATGVSVTKSLPWADEVPFFRVFRDGVKEVDFWTPGAAQEYVFACIQEDEKRQIRAKWEIYRGWTPVNDPTQDLYDFSDADRIYEA